LTTWKTQPPKQLTLFDENGGCAQHCSSKSNAAPRSLTIMQRHQGVNL